MPARAVVQPNGLFARFSTIVDNFTHVNYTREELWKVFRDECGLDCADGKIERAIAEPQRFEDEIDTIKMVHGPLEAERMKNYMSLPQDVVSGDVEPETPVVLPEGYRKRGQPFDVEQEIRDLQRHVAMMPATGDEDEDHMRNYYVKLITKYQNFINERNAATDEAHDRLVTEFFSQYR